MPRPKNPSKMLEKAKLMAMKNAIEVAGSIATEELVRLSRNIPTHALDDGKPEISHFRFDVGVREDLIDLAKLKRDPARSEAFIQNIEEVVNDYFRSREMSKRRPSPASQRVLFAEIGKAATRLQRLMISMLPDTRDMYHQSAPFIYANVWQDHRITIEHIIHLARRADKTLSQRTRPGRTKNTALDDLFPCLRFTVRKYVPSLARQTFGELVQIICAGAGISIPDANDSPRRFWALINPPFPPREKKIKSRS